MKFRLVVMTLLALCGLTLTPAVVLAQNGNDGLARLRRDHVYVSTNANPSLSEGDASQLSATIRDQNVPVYVAVVPDSVVDNVGGDYDKLPGYYGRQLGRPAVVAVVAGKHFRAGSSSRVGLAKGQAGDLANQAFDEENPGQNGGSIYPMLDRYVHLVAEARSERANSAGSGSLSGSSAGSSVPWLWIGFGLLLTMVLVLVAIAIASNAKERRLREQCEARLEACGEEVVALDAETTLDAEKKDYYQQGVTAYNQAREALPTADSTYQLEDVLRMLDSATRCFQRARGIIPTEPAGAGRHSYAYSGGSMMEEDDVPRARYNRRAGGYYYEGGTYNGVYYQPGYYDSDRFWEGMFIGQMLADDDRHDHDYDDHGSSGSDWSDDDGGSSSSDSGGGDWGSDSSDTDFGGGFDSGSDFGGGFDSGDSGGGDWS